MAIKIEEKEFHRSRVAFLIHNGEVLYLEGSTMSHIEWATSIGIDSTEFASITRGYARGGDIVFYKGDFEYDDIVKSDAIKYAPIIKEHCNMPSANVCLGVVVGNVGELWPPKEIIEKI